MICNHHKVRKAPDFLSKSGAFMANLPLVDTMHHVLKAWCIFYWFHFDSQGRWGQKGQNVECFPGAFFLPHLFPSARGSPSADSILDIS